ncbi:hypothetical protein EVAR_89445_1 [Eumeta japonica]|uniref:Uncharacterized protein n=1 Tax=Eumeta variegata TaxID=151549 RepID=A0A4C1Z0I4_EUMVA|nr:hypothetical protein EVAR_89445_1 [Eumeta japonica]
MLGPQDSHVCVRDKFNSVSFASCPGAALCDEKYSNIYDNKFTDHDIECLYGPPRAAGDGPGRCAEARLGRSSTVSCLSCAHAAAATIVSATHTHTRTHAPRNLNSDIYTSHFDYLVRYNFGTHSRYDASRRRALTALRSKTGPRTGL